MKQLSLFNLNIINEFCPDEDINYIHEQLTNLFHKYNIKNNPAKFEKWDHCPYLGYRYSIYVPSTGCNNYDRNFHDEFDRLTDEVAQKGIELTCLGGWGLSISTIFTDSRRKKNYAA